ncbi:hypothetical protein R6Z07M_012409 [Ovis aries]
MGALAVLLPCYLSSLIGYAGAGRRGRDPTSQKGLGGAPEGERLPSNGAVARRVPGLARGGSREAAAHPPRPLERSSGGCTCLPSPETDLNNLVLPLDLRREPLSRDQTQ